MGALRARPSQAIDGPASLPAENVERCGQIARLGDATPLRAENNSATLPPVCRPAGWIALWKRMAMVSVQQARPCP